MRGEGAGGLDLGSHRAGRKLYRVELGGVPLDVEPGDYTLVASLAAEPTPAPARVDVTITEPGAG